MMKFLSKKILFLSYGITTCTVISCSVFGAGLEKDNSRLNQQEGGVLTYSSRLVKAHESDITNITTHVQPHETNTQALATRFETQITELTTQLTPSARFEILERNASPPKSPIVAVIVNPVPAIALGNEAIYERFLRGKLIYRPTAGSDVGKVELSIADFVTRGQNPLESTFDLSGCGDASTYLSISTGYRKGKISVNSTKVEVWITPKFLIQSGITITPGILRNRISGPAAHYHPIVEGWNSTAAPLGLVYNWGGYEDLTWFDYLTSESLEGITSKNLYENWRASSSTHSIIIGLQYRQTARCFIFDFS